MLKKIKSFLPHKIIALSTEYNLDIMNKGKRQILSALFPLTRFVEIKNQKSKYY